MTAGEPEGDGRVSAAEMRMLEADARYARERAALYRARAWGGKRSTSAARMRHLEFVEKSTSERLRNARSKEG